MTTYNSANTVILNQDYSDTMLDLSSSTMNSSIQSDYVFSLDDSLTDYNISINSNGTYTGPVYTTTLTQNGRQLHVEGNAEINGSLRVGGRDIGECLDKIEERLAILRPNQGLEERWTELRELGQRYRELEKDILEKENLYGILGGKID